MKKIVFLIYILLETSFTGISQPVFQYRLGGAGDDAATSMVQSPDGGFVVCGVRNPIWSDPPHLYVSKISSSGILEWTKIFDSLSGGSQIINTSDGGFAITFDPGHQVLKLNGSGNVEWLRSYTGTGDGLLVKDIIETSDSGFALCGTDYLTGQPGNFYIAKTDANGVLQWTRSIGGNGSDLGSSIVQTDDGGYVVAGKTNSYGAGDFDGYIVKVSGSGSLLWAKTTGGSFDDEISSVSSTFDKGLVLCGISYSFSTDQTTDVYLVRLDSAANLIWDRVLSARYWDWGYSVVQSEDSGYVICGATKDYGYHNNLFLAKVDNGGTFEWARGYGEAGVSGYELEGKCVIRCNDGGYAICGRGMNTTSWEMYIAKTNADGLSCTTFDTAGHAAVGGTSIGSGGAIYDTMGSSSLESAGNIISGGSLFSVCSALSVSKVEKGDNTTIFPNPFSYKTTIRYSAHFQNATLKMYNSVGTIVKEINGIFGNSLEVYADSLPAGLYFIKTEDNKGGGSITKIIIEN